MTRSVNLSVSRRCVADPCAQVTVDLDVLVRNDLLDFLKKESEQRGASIIYATHIFDGLNEFPTHIAHMRDGRFVAEPRPWSPQSNTLHAMALKWLREDRDVRRNEELTGQRSKTRGAREDTVR